MFIAMNRFQVVKGSEEAFERLWQSRDSYLNEMAGFVEFHLLKGPKPRTTTLYSSHTVWESKAAFEAWTTSEQFRKSHARAGNSGARRRSISDIQVRGLPSQADVLRKDARRNMQVAAAKTDLAGILGRRSRRVVETVAKEHGVTARAVVEALPAAMRRFAPATAFADAMKDVATWGEVTLIVHTTTASWSSPARFRPARSGAVISI